MRRAQHGDSDAPTTLVPCAEVVVPQRVVDRRLRPCPCWNPSTSTLDAVLRPQRRPGRSAHVGPRRARLTRRRRVCRGCRHSRAKSISDSACAPPCYVVDHAADEFGIRRRCGHLAETTSCGRMRSAVVRPLLDRHGEQGRRRSIATSPMLPRAEPPIPGSPEGGESDRAETAIALRCGGRGCQSTRRGRGCRSGTLTCTTSLVPTGQPGRDQRRSRRPDVRRLATHLPQGSPRVCGDSLTAVLAGARYGGPAPVANDPAATSSAHVVATDAPGLAKLLSRTAHPVLADPPGRELSPLRAIACVEFLPGSRDGVGVVGVHPGTMRAGPDREARTWRNPAVDIAGRPEGDVDPRSVDRQSVQKGRAHIRARPDMHTRGVRGRRWGSGRC